MAKTILFKKRSISIHPAPAWNDPRYVQLFILAAYAMVAVELFHMDRSHWITLGCLLLALAIDGFIGVTFYRTIRFPVSALVVAFASSLLIDARSGYVYFLAVGLSLSSKAIFTYKGRHYFNPANFGVVVVLLLLPHTATGFPALFGGYIIPSVVFFLLGVFTVIYAGQALVSFSWLGSFMLFCFLRAQLGQGEFFMNGLIILAPSFLLFTFHMISDPETTPQSSWLKVFFGFSIAAIDAIFRLLEIPYGNFYALFFVSALLPLIRELRYERQAALRSKPRRSY